MRMKKFGKEGRKGGSVEGGGGEGGEAKLERQGVEETTV